jgi:DNA-binding SARP family transcriptional activator
MSAGVAVEFALLGDIEARIGGDVVEIGHVRQRCVLAVLLVTPNRVVPVDQLLDRAWGERLPQCAAATLRSYLSRLRQVLAGADGVRLLRKPGGYIITVDPLCVDVHRFHRLAAEARVATDAGAALALFDQALRLWRGDALAALDTPWLIAVGEALERERLAVELDRNDLLLARGGHAQLVGELVASADAHPLDERLAGQLMLALYRSGRPASALDRYERLRQQLAAELGTDPSPRLRELHQQILTATVPPVRARLAVTAVPRQLPAPPPAFTGRTRELAQLDTVPIAVIGGTGGIGKTWLALRWAHDNLSRFPDGQLYVNLRGFDPAGEPVAREVAVRGFLDALGVEPAAIPVDLDAQTCLYRSVVAGKRMLIVLDNARDTNHVTPLLPGTASCTVLVTSRHQLGGLVANHSARPLTLDMLAGGEARELIGRHLGADRVAAEPAAVDAIVAACAGLPLALGIAAARAALRPDIPLAVLAAQLREARLDGLDAGELAANLRAALYCSYRALPAAAANAFRLLGLVAGGDLGLPAAASLCAQPAALTRALLHQLISAHLVQEPVPGRYRLHDLVRLYAAELTRSVDPDDVRRAALHRLLDHYLHTAHAADRCLHPHRDPIALAPAVPGAAPESIGGHRHAMTWLTTEHRALLAAIHQAAAAGFDTHVWQLAWSLVTYFDRRGHWRDRGATQRAALAAAKRLADRHAQAAAHRGIALAYTWLGRYDEARVEVRAALDLFSELGDRAGQADAHRSLARSWARQHRHRDALPHDLRALELYRLVGHRAGQATALNALGWHHAHLGNHRAALAYCGQALALHLRHGDRLGQANAWDSLGYAHHHLGHHRHAIGCYRRALELFRDIGDQSQEVETLSRLGDAHCAGGEADRAVAAWRQALAIVDELGLPDTEGVRVKLSGDGPRQVPQPHRAVAG